MASLAQSRRFSLSSPTRSREIRALFTADRADEEETAATIRTTLRETVAPGRSAYRGGACGRGKGTRDPAMPMIVLGTAHPAKFPEAVEAACGVRPDLPDWLSDLDLNGRNGLTPMPADQGAVEKFILAASRAAREGAAA